MKEKEEDLPRPVTEGFGDGSSPVTRPYSIQAYLSISSLQYSINLHYVLC